MSGTGLGQTTGTFSFNPSAGEIVLYAFARCGLRRTQLVAEHYADARLATNMILSDWSNRQPNLWTVELNTVSCVQGQATYTVPANVVLVLDAYLRITSGSTYQDYFMYPISRTEWAAFPDKTTPDRPTVYWFDRLIAPSVTLWQPPDSSSYSFQYYAVRQVQDAALANGGILEIPYYFLNAFACRLSAELAVMYAPERAIPLMAEAEKAWQIAANRNAEDVPLYLTPGLNAYYRD